MDIRARCTQVAEQHTRNRRLALVCDHCFRYCGPLELQLGFRLLHCKPPPGVADPTAKAEALLSGADKLPCLLEAQRCDERMRDGGDADANAADWLIPAHLRRLAAAAQQARTQSAGCAAVSSTGAAMCGSADGRSSAPRKPLGSAVVLNDGSQYVFCSHDCAALAWVTWAALLSPGRVQDTAKGTGAAAPQASSHMATSLDRQAGPAEQGDGVPASFKLPRSVRESPYVLPFDAAQLSGRVHECCALDGLVDTFAHPDCGSGATSSRSDAAPIRPPWLPRATERAPVALRAFLAHADATNDAFRVAARAVAIVATSARLHALVRRRASSNAPSDSHPVQACTHGRTGATRSDSDSVSLGCDERAAEWDDLRSAWTPFQAVHKKVWWELVPMPDDLDDEEAWRQQLRCACVFTVSSVPEA